MPLKLLTPKIEDLTGFIVMFVCHVRTGKPVRLVFSKTHI